MIQSISVRIMVEIILIVVCIWMCSGVKLRGEGGFRTSIVRLIPACGGVESRSAHDQNTSWVVSEQICAEMPQV